MDSAAAVRWHDDDVVSVEGQHGHCTVVCHVRRTGPASSEFQCRLAKERMIIRRSDIDAWALTNGRALAAVLF